MRLHKLGAMLCLVLASCNEKDPPPVIEICILDGFGGADCIERDGSQKYRAPTELTNFWATNQDDMAAFSSWCYKIPQVAIEKELDTIKGDVTPPVPHERLLGD